VPSQVEQQLQCRWVSPVQIVQQDRDRRKFGDRLDKRCHGEKQALFLLSTPDYFLHPEMIGQENAEIRPATGSVTLELQRSRRIRHRKRFQKRVIRHALLSLVAATGGNQETTIAEM